MNRRLPRSFFARDPALVAPELLNKVLSRDDGRSGRIVEVEAYRGRADPAAHSFRGPTPRTAVMFGPPGHLYVYFTYGMHWCANVICGSHSGEGILLRALAPLAGIAQMQVGRPRVTRTRDLCNGPARLTQAMGIDGSFNGLDLSQRGAPITLRDDDIAPPLQPVLTTRIGLTRGVDELLRWYVPDCVFVSHP